MKQIEYFYSTHSAFAYIGSAKLLDIAAAAGREVVHRPVNLGPVMQAAGGKPSRERTDAHRQYFFGREIERWAEHRQVPIIDYRPTHHDNSLA
ncbi:MAG: DsbA family protein, partial [Pseudomonadota bacterium]